MNIIRKYNESFLIANSVLQINFLPQYLTFDEKFRVEIIEGAFQMNKENKNVCKVTTKFQRISEKSD